MQSGCFYTLEDVWAFCLHKNGATWHETPQKESTKPEGVLRQLRVMRFALAAQYSTPVCARRAFVVARINWPTGLDDCSCQKPRIGVADVSVQNPFSQILACMAWNTCLQFSKIINLRVPVTIILVLLQLVKKEFILEIRYYSRQNVYTTFFLMFMGPCIVIIF
jgi:hypothetical protein